MHANWCVLIEISIEIGMLNFWSVIICLCNGAWNSLYNSDKNGTLSKGSFVLFIFSSKVIMEAIKNSKFIISKQFFTRSKSKMLVHRQSKNFLCIFNGLGVHRQIKEQKVVYQNCFTKFEIKKAVLYCVLISLIFSGNRRKNFKRKWVPAIFGWPPFRNGSCHLQRSPQQPGFCQCYLPPSHGWGK